MKRIVSAVLCLVFLSSIFLIFPTGAVSADTAAQEAGDGSITDKEEVVYASLDRAGALLGIYVVNQFTVAKAGWMIDYGSYDSVKNLTDAGDITSNGDSVRFQAQAGQYAYQGNRSGGVLPWDVTIQYMLDGQEISPAQLAGKSGKLGIRLKTKANTNVDSRFYEHYMLQISCSLSTISCRNITAEGGVIANAGANKLVTFTCLPGTDGDYIISADVSNFHMDGIDIAAMPFSMDLSLSDGAQQLSTQLTPLLDAIAQLNDGTQALAQGISDMSAGVGDTREGIGALHRGAQQLKENTPQLTEGSAMILEALQTIQTELARSGALKMLDTLGALNPLKELIAGIEQLAEQYGQMHAGLLEYTDGVQQLADGVAALYDGSGQLAEGSDALAGGSSELAGGTQQLATQTADLPTQIQEGIDELTQSITGGEFQPISYTDAKNDKVSAVQFVIKVQGISLEQEIIEESPPQKPSLWDRFLALFRRNDD